MQPAISQAFVLGAGLGTRLKALTGALPKPLVPVAGRPLMTHAFDHLIGHGIRRFIVNTHHCAAAYRTAFPDDHYRGCPITFRHEPELLETGGGLKNIEDLAGDQPLLVYNGDIHATLPLQPAIEAHLASGNEVTLVLRSSGEARHVAFEATGAFGEQGEHRVGRVIDIRNRLGRGEGTHLFTGIYLVSPAFFRRLRREKISVVEPWLAMLREERASLGAIVIDHGDWRDLGTRGEILALHSELQHRTPEAPWVHPSAEVHPTARLLGASSVGAGAVVGAGAELCDSHVWERARVAPGSRLLRTFVTAGKSIAGNHADADL